MSSYVKYYGSAERTIVILVTGAAGLIGRHLCTRLENEGLEVRRFDIKCDPSQDTRNRQNLIAALDGISGIVHLAAISRVVWGEKDPALCWTTNVEALMNMVELCLRGTRPWLIFASSREVYGAPQRLPITEDHPLQPINVYGRSKRDGELIIQSAIKSGLTANICRLSNVYGCAYDHPDRVVMAFARAAARGGKMVVEGGANTFDFTFIEDAVEGLWRLIQASMCGESLPPVHFVTGSGTTLGELAQIARRYALRNVDVEEASPRAFDVSMFIGDPARSAALLGWHAQTNIREGISKLIGELAKVEYQDQQSSRVAPLS